MIGVHVMRLRFGILVALVALSAAGCAYHAPDAPTPPPPASTTAPAFLTLGAAAGSGTAAGQSTVTAKVQNVGGTPLANVAVSFTTDLGTVSPASAATNDNGIATTTVASADSVRVTATTGSLTTVLVVPSPPPPVTPTPTPTPQPPPQPSPLGPVTMSISTAPVIVGTSTVFTANIQNASGVFTLTWDYGDGDTSTSSSSTTAHTYGAAGTYRATAILRDDTGRSASASVNAVVNPNPVATPPTPRPAAISATLGCTGTTLGAMTFCNVTVLDQDGNVVTGQVPNNAVDWDWGDGDRGSVGVTSNHTYRQAGSYTVSTVVSLNGLRTSASKALVIQ